MIFEQTLRPTAPSRSRLSQDFQELTERVRSTRFYVGKTDRLPASALSLLRRAGLTF
jgi:hypothetical protein